MTDESPESSNEDDLLAVALASGYTVAESARRANMGERTAHRRLEDPAFRRRVDNLRGQIVSRALSMLNRSMARAARELAKLLGDEDPKVRLQAAREILKIALDGRQRTETELKLAELLDRLDAIAAKGK